LVLLRKERFLFVKTLTDEIVVDRGEDSITKRNIYTRKGEKESEKRDGRGGVRRRRWWW